MTKISPSLRLQVTSKSNFAKPTYWSLNRAVRILSVNLLEAGNYQSRFLDDIVVPDRNKNRPFQDTVEFLVKPDSQKINVDLCGLDRETCLILTIFRNKASLIGEGVSESYGLGFLGFSSRWVLKFESFNT